MYTIFKYANDDRANNINTNCRYKMMVSAVFAFGLAESNIEPMQPSIKR